MSRRKRRLIFDVCAAVSNTHELLIKTVAAFSSLEAKQKFVEEYQMAPLEILGPFNKRQHKTIPTTCTIKFDPQQKSFKAIYHDWVVDAFPLLEPANYAYLIFQKRIDDKKTSAPKGTITVPITDLRTMP